MSSIDRRAVVGAGLALSACASPNAQAAASSAPSLWTKLPTEPYRGKQDDVVVLPSGAGWYGNGAGKLFATRDGGETWTEVWRKPGTFIRALGFIDEQRGVLGNVGPGYYPGVTDPEPLYVTDDGGASWRAPQITGPRPTGICGIHVLPRRGGALVHAAGRVGGPAFFLRSEDLGRTWRSSDLTAHTAMIFDVLFLDERIGFLCGGTSAQAPECRPLVLKTTDGGATWRTVFRGERPYELTWKVSFPSRRVGYVTVQSYNPDKAASQRVVLKSVDGGDSWRELPVTQEHAWRAFGVGFVDERRGWIGGTTTGMETADGGLTWSRVEMGKAVNKVRVVRSGSATSVYAIGTDLHRLVLRRT